MRLVDALVHPGLSFVPFCVVRCVACWFCSFAFGFDSFFTNVRVERVSRLCVCGRIVARVVWSDNSKKEDDDKTTQQKKKIRKDTVVLLFVGYKEMKRGEEKKGKKRIDFFFPFFFLPRVLLYYYIWLYGFDGVDIIEGRTMVWR